MNAKTKIIVAASKQAHSLVLVTKGCGNTQCRCVTLPGMSHGKGMDGQIVKGEELSVQSQ